jgi:hypothetical protein
MFLGLGLILLLVLGAIAIAPKRPSAPAAPSGTPQPLFMQAPEPMAPVAIQSMSFREQMLSEEAAEVSAAFRDAANKKWREEVIAKASTLLTSP